MLSYSKGPNASLLDRTIGEQLQMTAQRWPHRLALLSRFQRRKFTWSELLDVSDRIAHGLDRLGLQPGDRVGIWAMNCWEWLVVHMACARAGVVLVNVNPASCVHELAFILEKSHMRALFLRESYERAQYADILAWGIRGNVKSVPDEPEQPK